MTISYRDDVDYARDKLIDSFIRYNDDVVLIVDMFEDGICHTKTLAGKYIDIHMSDLDLEPVTLGYVNLGFESEYWCRSPCRHYRQGFRANTLRKITRAGIGSINMIPPALVSTVLNRYPSIDSCMEQLVNGEVISKAFSRCFAVENTSKGYNLNYKGYKSGKVNEENGEVSLDNKFMFLSGVLENAIR